MHRLSTLFLIKVEWDEVTVLHQPQDRFVDECCVRQWAAEWIPTSQFAVQYETICQWFLVPLSLVDQWRGREEFDDFFD